MEFLKSPKYGVSALLIVLSAIGASLVSFVTVATGFYLQELANITKWFETYGISIAENQLAGFVKDLSPGLMFIATPLAFELALISVGFIKGMRSGKLEMSKTSEYVAFAVVCSLGLERSGVQLADITWFPQVFGELVTVVTSFTTAFGAPLLIFFGANNVGVIVMGYLKDLNDIKESYKNKVAEAKNAYDALLTEWEAGFSKWYEKNAIKIFEVERRDKAYVLRNDDGTAPAPAPKAQKPPSIAKRVYDELKDLGLSPHDIGDKEGVHLMTPAQLAERLGVESGPVRTALSRLRADWPAEPK